MFFKPGDRVIKNTGGNKMTIVSCTDKTADCVWITENFNQSTFEVEELLPLNQYDKIRKIGKREDLINQLLE
jgi:uncharacterized protein YodC (DUF2158 family)